MRKPSSADPLQIAAQMTPIAGPGNLLFALTNGTTLVPAGIVLAAGLVGFISYSMTLAPFILDLRHLSTARTGASSLAPFVSAVNRYDQVSTSPR